MYSRLSHIPLCITQYFSYISSDILIYYFLNLWYQINFLNIFILKNMIFTYTENTTSLGTNSNCYNKNSRKRNLTSVQNRESNQISPLRDWNSVLTFKRYLNSDWFATFPLQFLNENLCCWKIFPVAFPKKKYLNFINHDKFFFF